MLQKVPKLINTELINTFIGNLSRTDFFVLPCAFEIEWLARRHRGGKVKNKLRKLEKRKRT